MDDKLLPDTNNGRSVMTIVMMSYFTGKIEDIEKIFYMLPAVRTEQPKPKRKVKKIKFAHPGKPGVIISARYKGKVRGAVRALNQKSWKHSVVVDMSEETKNISFKISPTNLHMCGCKSIEMGVKASKMMIDHINQAQEDINFIQENSQLSEKISKIILRDCSYIDDQGNYLFDIRKWKEDHTFLGESETRMIGAMSRLWSDIRTHNGANFKLKWAKTITPFISEPLKYDHFVMGMIKYRFHLGFAVDLSDLVKYFGVLDRRFFLNYFSGIRNKAVLEFPCFNRPESKHTFSVERSGQVTHSCSVLNEVDEVFTIFMDNISEIVSRIIAE